MSRKQGQLASYLSSQSPLHTCHRLDGQQVLVEGHNVTVIHDGSQHLVSTARTRS